MPAEPDELCGDIPSLLRHLAQAFEGLRVENDRLRAQVEALAHPEGPALGGSEGQAAAQRDASVGHDQVLLLPGVGDTPTERETERARPPGGLPLPPSEPDPTTSMDFTALDSTPWRTSGVSRRSEASKASFDALAFMDTAHSKSDIEDGIGTLLETWDDIGPVPCRSHSISPAQAAQDNSQRSVLPIQRVRTGDVLRSTGLPQRFMVAPNTWKVFNWDMLSLVVLSFDLLVSPLAVFDISVGERLVLFSAIFWSTDIPFRACVGFYDHGILEMRPRRVFVHYLLHSFPLDAMMVSFDWIVFVIGAGSSSTKVVRLHRGMRLLRLVRLARFLRVFKLIRMWESLEAVQRSAGMATVIKVGKKVTFIIVVNHFVACAWYGISNYCAEERDGLRAWSLELRPDRHEESRPSTFYFYTTALHWALTQFTPASMEVYPRNAVERVFTIIVMIMSLLAFSSVVATMTSNMTALMQRNAEHTKQKELLDRFIQEHKVSLDLGTRINSFMNRERVRMENRPVLESQVPLLQKLPENLKNQLHVEVFTNVLLWHPLLSELGGQDRHRLEQVCYHAMRDEFFALQEAMWASGEIATKMFFVLRGELQCMGYPLTKQASSSVVDAKAGDMLCEEAMWLKWAHAENMVSLSDVAAFTLETDRFARIFRRSSCAPLLRVYARLFRDGLEYKTTASTVTSVAKDMVNEAVKQSGSCSGRLEEPAQGSSAKSLGRIAKGFRRSHSN